MFLALVVHRVRALDQGSLRQVSRAGRQIAAPGRWLAHWPEMAMQTRHRPGAYQGLDKNRPRTGTTQLDNRPRRLNWSIVVWTLERSRCTPTDRRRCIEPDRCELLNIALSGSDPLEPEVTRRSSRVRSQSRGTRSWNLCRVELASRTHESPVTYTTSGQPRSTVAIVVRDSLDVRLPASCPGAPRTGSPAV